MSVTHEAGTAEEALQVGRTSVVNLAIVDLSLGDGTGLDVIRQLRQVAPWLPILVLSIHDEALFAERALKAGARGYVMKNEASNQLIGAIRQVLDGRIFMSDRATQSLLEAIGRQRPTSRSGLELLSDRARSHGSRSRDCGWAVQSAAPV